MKNRMKKIMPSVCTVGLVLNNVPTAVLAESVESNMSESDIVDDKIELNDSILDNSCEEDKKYSIDTIERGDANIEYIDIEDINLIKAINRTLNKENLNSNITKEDMELITELDISGENIESLNGIEYAINLVDLNISNNNISDISFVSKLTKLERLNASNNNISDISCIATLTNLIELDLSNVVRLSHTDSLEGKSNKIEDISYISKLKKITKLNLSNNIINDIKPLINLNNLINLDLSGNSIIDISNIKNISSLEILRVSNQLVKLDSIKLTDTALNIPYNVKDETGNILIPSIISNGGVYEEGLVKWIDLNESISDLSAIFDKEVVVNDSLTTYFSGKIVQSISIDKRIEIEDKVLLNELNLLLNKKEDNTDILRSELESLEVLKIDNSKLKSLKGLEYAINLKELTIRNSSLTNFDIISNFKYLIKLDLMDNNIESIDFLNNLEDLEYLNLQGNNIKSINSINGRLTLLKELNISYNNLYSIQLNSLNNLIKLDASNNHISTVVGMEDITSLEELNLNNNNIGDISLLMNLENLTKLSVENQVVYLPVLKYSQRTFNIENTVMNIDSSLVEPTLIYGNGYINGELITWKNIDENTESLEFEFSDFIQTESGFLGIFSGKVIQPLEVELFSDEGYLNISLSTNQIKFENFTGLEDVEIIKAIEMNVDSDKAYNISASIPSRIRNVDGDKELNPEVLSIKESNAPDYISFVNLNDSVLLMENVASGVNTHTFDFKLNKDKFLEKDSYRAVIKFEINQK